MKVLKLFSRSTPEPSQPAVSLPIYDAALRERAEAMQAHISDLRVLVDQAHERERELAGMVRLVMEERFYRPVVTRQRPSAAIPDGGVRNHVEHLSDVAQFDEQVDAEIVAAQEKREGELRGEFNKLFVEEQEYRAARGHAEIAV